MPARGRSAGSAAGGRASWEVGGRWYFLTSAMSAGGSSIINVLRYRLCVVRARRARGDRVLYQDQCMAMPKRQIVWISIYSPSIAGPSGRRLGVEGADATRRPATHAQLPAESRPVNPTPLPDTEILSRSQLDPASRRPMGGLELVEGRPGEANVICLNLDHYHYHCPAMGLAGCTPYPLVS